MILIFIYAMVSLRRVITTIMAFIHYAALYILIYFSMPHWQRLGPRTRYWLRAEPICPLERHLPIYQSSIIDIHILHYFARQISASNKAIQLLAQHRITRNMP